LRITGGTKRGATLLALEGNETRPTLDHIKEAVFSMLGSGLFDARVLDLYAGSGAIGLECLSRGAKEAVFVEESPQAAKIILKNIDKLHYEDSTVVLAVKDSDAIETLKRKGQCFELVYLDPPFGKTSIEGTLKKLLTSGLLSIGGCVIVEEAFEQRVPLVVEGMMLDKDKRYGRISIRILRRMT